MSYDSWTNFICIIHVFDVIFVIYNKDNIKLFFYIVGRRDDVSLQINCCIASKKKKKKEQQKQQTLHDVLFDTMLCVTLFALHVCAGMYRGVSLPLIPQQPQGHGWSPAYEELRHTEEWSHYCFCFLNHDFGLNLKCDRGHRQFVLFSVSLKTCKPNPVYDFCISSKPQRATESTLSSAMNMKRTGK